MMPGIPELLIILVIVLFIFGPKRLKNIASGLGDAIKGFRKAVTDDKKESDASSFNNVLDEKVIDGSEVEPKSDTQKTEKTTTRRTTTMLQTPTRKKNIKPRDEARVQPAGHLQSCRVTRPESNRLTNNAWWW